MTPGDFCDQYRNYFTKNRHGHRSAEYNNILWFVGDSISFDPGAPTRKSACSKYNRLGMAYVRILSLTFEHSFQLE